MKILTLLFGLFAALFVGTAVSMAMPVSPLVAAGGLSITSLFISTPKGVAKGLLVELWTGELIKKFRHAGEWLARIPSQNNYVQNNVIHLVDVGADPAVLIDNTSYPIATAARTDADVAVALKKFDTENTLIKDDELYALPYDKVGSVLNQHRETLEEQTKAYGLFSLAPASNAANTPVIATSGSASKIVTGFKGFTPADMRAMKHKLDILKIPKKGRIVIMHPDHSAALLDLDTSFRDKYINTKTGDPINHFGFEIFEDPDAPIYDVAGSKKAFGAAVIGTDRPGSVFVYAPRAFKAMGTVTMYRSLAKEDPKNRETVIGFRMHHIVLPKKNIGFGAVISAPN